MVLYQIKTKIKQLTNKKTTEKRTKITKEEIQAIIYELEHPK